MEISDRQKRLEPKLPLTDMFFPHNFAEGMEKLENLKPGDKVDLSPYNRDAIFKEVITLGSGKDYPNDGDECEVKYKAYLNSVSEENLFESSEWDNFQMSKGKTSVYSRQLGGGGSQGWQRTLLAKETTNIYLMHHLAPLVGG